MSNIPSINSIPPYNSYVIKNLIEDGDGNKIYYDDNYNGHVSGDTIKCVELFYGFLRREISYFGFKKFPQTLFGFNVEEIDGGYRISNSDPLYPEFVEAFNKFNQLKLFL